MWYREGTISVTNGSTVVTGVNTYWAASIMPGDSLLVNGKQHEIASVQSDTQLTLVDAFAEASVVDSEYAVIVISTTTSGLASRITNVATLWQTRENEIAAWQAGTINGGPNLDGRYPLTAPDGTITYAYCPAAISAMSSGASDWADYPEDVEIPGFPGRYSSMHWSNKSEDYAILAAESEALLAPHYSNIGTVATNITNVNTVASMASDIDAVLLDQANIDSVATNITNVSTVASDLTNIDAVVANATNINAVAANSVNINTTAGMSADIDAVLADKTNIDAVATNIENVNSVAANAININTVAADSADINTIISMASDIDAVLLDQANIDSVATNITNVNTVASMASDIDAVILAAGAVGAHESTYNHSTYDSHIDGAAEAKHTKTQVGLGNVDNTSDADKPVSTAQQEAFDLKLDTSDASLTPTAGKIPIAGADGRISAGWLPLHVPDTYYVEMRNLISSDAGANDYFGFACALSDDASVLAVGAPYWDGPAGSNQGTVYVYDWDGSSWIERGLITPSDAGASDFFGHSCALSDDASVLAVGAYYWDGPAGSNQGTVYVYDWDGSSWIERGLITPSDAGADDYFGRSCALSADASVLAVGAPYWDGPAGSGDQGTVYIYDWNGSSWIERGLITHPSDAGVSDYFGYSCALSDDASVLAVGAYYWDGPAGSNQGTVYVYDWDGSSWIERGLITPSDAGANDYFGASCALSADGSVLAVGASHWDGSAGSDQGTVYVYDWDGSSWIERGLITPSDAGESDFFGDSCALSADASVLAVGACLWDGPAGSNQGTVYQLNGVK